MKLYRYETQLDNGYIEGIFQATFDSDLISKHEVLRYYDLCKQLQRPRVQGDVIFYFTESGNDYFYELVDIAFKAIPKKSNPKLLKIVEDINLKDVSVLYEDQYQLAIEKEV